MEKNSAVWFSKKKLFQLILILLTAGFIFSFTKNENETQWIRINQLGYTPQGIKVAVWCSKDDMSIHNFDLIDSASGKKVFTNKSGRSFGAYGPFTNTYRLNFSTFKRPGVYF